MKGQSLRRCRRNVGNRVMLCMFLTYFKLTITENWGFFVESPEFCRKNGWVLKFFEFSSGLEFLRKRSKKALSKHNVLFPGLRPALHPPPMAGIHLQASGHVTRVQRPPNWLQPPHRQQPHHPPINPQSCHPSRSYAVNSRPRAASRSPSTCAAATRCRSSHCWPPCRPSPSTCPRLRTLPATRNIKANICSTTDSLTSALQTLWIQGTLTATSTSEYTPKTKKWLMK